MSGLRLGLCGVSVSSFLAQEKVGGEAFCFWCWMLEVHYKCMFMRLLGRVKEGSSVTGRKSQ